MLSLTTVTQRDVAAACNVHPSTICLALKNAPSIPVETRLRIQRTAARMGYAPNAAARNLAFLRTEKNHAGGSLPLAWLNQEPQRDFWRSDPDAYRIFTAAKTRAARLGYALTDIWVAEPGLRLERLSQILEARGIEGVVFPVARIFDRRLMQPVWASFATVALGDYRAGAWLDVVCADYYYNLELALTSLGERGFKRVGLLLDQRFDDASGGLTRSCYLGDQAERSESQRVPPCRIEAGPAAAEKVLAWWARYQPDAVVCGGRFASATAITSLPEAVRMVGLQSGDEMVDGVDDRSELVATSAIDRLAAKVQGREKRFGADTQRSLVKGHWCGGSPLPEHGEVLFAVAN